MGYQMLSTWKHRQTYPVAEWLIKARWLLDGSQSYGRLSLSMVPLDKVGKPVTREPVAKQPREGTWNHLVDSPACMHMHFCCCCSPSCVSINPKQGDQCCITQISPNSLYPDEKIKTFSISYLKGY